MASELPDGAFQLRPYSLSSAPEDPLWRITVRRSRSDGGRPAGEVSSFLHDRVGIGSTLLVSPPFGEVVLDDFDAPLLLASSGIGATSLVGMLRRLGATGPRRPVTVVHADRSAWTHPLRFDVERCVRDLGERLHVWYEDVWYEDVWYEDTEDAPAHARRGPVDLTEPELPPGTRAHLCGPGSSTRELRPALVRAGLTPKGIGHEVFGPDLWQDPG
ncbi:hypothetical protein [Streptomyces sp. NPDC001380]|uniref:hypothetical protein n=1 Tax=Streptomyces sp. NPDC001380 TaxID=3364566 RepID=UPI0036B4EF23